MKFGFIMDPIENVNIDADTTFAFMLAAKEAGHEVYYLEMQDLSARGAQAFGIWQSCDVRREKGNHYTLSEPEFGSLDTFDVLFMRKDPPFDIAYLHACHLLELAEERGVLVVNKPSGLRAANEKLYALHFEEVIPDTIVTRSATAIKAFLEEVGGKCILKPVDGHGGDGIFMLDAKDRNLNAIIEVSTHTGKERVICQRYLPAARAGDKRVILLAGTPLGGILRVPREDDNRGNIHVGGTVVKAELTERDLAICEAVGPKLVEDGLWFVGLDIIGDHLTEVNVTSPTGIQEMSRLNEIDGAGAVIAWAAAAKQG